MAFNALHDAALSYAADGWPILPCNFEKRPLCTNGVDDATTDMATINEWWTRWPGANPAVACGKANLLVIDIDPGADREELARVVEGLPDTLRQTTPRGGEHFFYGLNQDVMVPSSIGRLCPNVDVRSHQGYVLLAPSKTVDGTYSWRNNNLPRPLPHGATLPMIKACGQSRAKSANAEVWLIPPDKPENLALAIDYLQGNHRIPCLPAIEGKGGNDTTFRTATMLRSFGISPEVCLDLLDNEYNPRCDPPWEYEDLARIRDNAYLYATSPPGNLTPAYKEALIKSYFKPVSRDTEAHEAREGKFRAVDYEGLMATPDPEWLIPGLIEDGAYTLMVASPKSGKTFCALDIALSVAVGSVKEPRKRSDPGSGPGQARAWPVVNNPGPVLYAIGEGRAGIKSRVKAWVELHNDGKRPEGFVIVDPVALVAGGEAEWAQFISVAKAWHDEYALVVIDTAGRSMAGLDENAAAEVSRLTAFVSFLQEHLNCGVLVLHHEAKSAKGGARGSGVFEADPDTVITLTREPKSSVVQMDVKFHRNGPEWDHPRQLVMASHGNTKVITATQGDEQTVAISTRKRAAPKFARKALELAIIDDAIMEVLGHNKLLQWTTTKLAEKVATEVLEGVSSIDLRKEIFRKVREELTNSKSRKCYDAETARWRWVDD